MNDFGSSTVAPALFALFAWWFGTGAILWLVRRPVRSFRSRMTGMSVLAIASLWGAHHSMQASDVGNAYLGFASVIVMWGWHELAFLSGWIIGPRRVPLTPGARGVVRFRESLQAILHHEFALLANFGVLLLMQNGEPNHVAICTFALLWCMRLSAKLNLFFGVPEVGEQYLPSHLTYLGSYFRRGPVSVFFYFSISIAAGSWLWLVGQAQLGAVTVNTGWVLLAALLGLAIIEHLLMMFPLPMQRLWGWAMGRSTSVSLPSTTSGLPVVPAVPVIGPEASRS
jgi:putative photosynthetic complex assembly protein 2